MLTPLELEVAQLLVTTLRLEEPPEAIPPEEPLFVDGLGLDSIDALEIALAISKTYGFEIRSDDADNRRIFSNLRALAGHVERHRAR
jgi:acyl carrier protein